MADTTRLTKLTNEIVVFIPELDWDPMYLQSLREGGTKQITVDQVRDFRTPFGTRMIIATLTAVRFRAQTWDLKQYVYRTLIKQGWTGELQDVLTPGRAKHYRV